MSEDGTGPALPSEVPVEPASISRLHPLVGSERLAHVRGNVRTARERLDGRTVWHISDNPGRGGVAELLRANLPYQHAEGIRLRWTVLDTAPEFKAFVKRLYYLLCGAPDSAVPGTLSRDRAMYERECGRNAARIAAAAEPGTVFVVHDHQAAGVLPLLRDAGHTVIWRLHTCPRSGQEPALHAWDFLRPYVAAAHAWVSSTPDALPPDLLAERRYTIPPSIDPLSMKNLPLGHNVDAAHIAAKAGVLEAPPPGMIGLDAYSDLLIRNRATMVGGQGPIPREVPLITQVSRWDRIKDIPGVIRAFAEYVDPTFEAHLALVGPRTSQDPAGAEVFQACFDLWSRLCPAGRDRVHLVQLPDVNHAEQALTVNALQRRSTVIAQKSLAEGFGLTVTEAAWKARPVVASPVGGILGQVEHGKTGLLLTHPDDLEGFGAAVNLLVADEHYAASLGRNARDRVHRDFLVDTELNGMAELLSVLGGRR